MALKVYYLNHNVFQKGDVRKAWVYASHLLKQYEYIDTITLLVNQSQHYEPFIQNELGISVKQCKEHLYPNKIGKKIQIHTVRTYSPNDISTGERGRDLLIAIGVPTKDLIPFLDKSRIEFVIIVPWLIDANAQLLRIYKAIDIESKKSCQCICELDERVKHAIEWIQSTCNPNEGFIHPYDEDGLKQMANTLSHNKIPFDYDAVVSYAIMQNIIPTSAFQIAKYFTKAQHRKYTTTIRKVNYKLMKEQLYRNDFI